MQTSKRFESFCAAVLRVHRKGLVCIFSHNRGRKLRFRCVQPQRATLIRVAFKLFESLLSGVPKKRRGKSLSSFLVRLFLWDLRDNCVISRTFAQGKKKVCHCEERSDVAIRSLATRRVAYTGRDSLIIVATSVCTGGSNSPPDCCIYNIRVLFRVAKMQTPKWVSAFLVHRKGLEPPTLGTGIRCSIH